MKRLVYIGILGSLVFCISTLIAYSQPDQETLLKKEMQAKSVVDNESYVIGAEDVLYIHVWKEEALSRTVPVRMDGNISLPLIHQIRTDGLTPLQLEDAIVEKLKGYYENPIVTVTVMEINSFRVYVSGEVKTPGVYRLRSETNILQIIPMAGGFKEWAKKKKILVIRKENGKEKRFIVNYKKAMKGDDPSSNVILKPGDTIIVP